MALTSRTPTGIAYDRAGPAGGPPVVLIHAGVADRRMWDPLWPELTAERDAIRLDLRGFGDSGDRPAGALSPVGDVLDVLAALGVTGPSHLVGASYGAGVAVELALAEPSSVASLLLAAPGGSLIPELTPDLRTFVEAERAALTRGDLTAAVEANIAWWVEGPQRRGDEVDPAVRDLVRLMQRRAFELTADWDDVEAAEADPPALDRLGELRAPTLVLLGALDLRAIHAAAARLTADVPDVRRVDWPDVAHLPSLERPSDFHALLRDWLASHGA